MKRTIFAIFDDESDLWMDAKYSGIHPLVILTDALTFRMEKKKTSKKYMRVLDVITWHKTELDVTKGKSGNVDVYRTLLGILAEHEDMEHSTLNARTIQE